MWLRFKYYLIILLCYAFYPTEKQKLVENNLKFRQSSDLYKITELIGKHVRRLEKSRLPQQAIGYKSSWKRILGRPRKRQCETIADHITTGRCWWRRLIRLEFKKKKMKLANCVTELIYRVVSGHMPLMNYTPYTEPWRQIKSLLPHIIYNLDVIT